MTDFNSHPVGWRHIITLMLSLGMFCLYSTRICISIAIVAMVNHTAISIDPKNIDYRINRSEAACARHQGPMSPGTSGITQTKDGPFVWDSKTQGLILSSFFYGYVVTQILGGYLAQAYGGKWVIGLSSLFVSLSLLLNPTAVYFGPGSLIAINVAQGHFAGLFYPAFNVLLSQWVPPNERSTLVAIAVSGCLGCIWFVLWVVFASNGPADHKFISKIERAYIVDSMPEVMSGNLNKWNNIPWRCMASSAAFWAIIVSQFTHHWSFYVLMTSLPTYFKLVQNLEKYTINGILSALPYLFAFGLTLATGRLGDALITRAKMHTIYVRKIFDCLGHFLPAVFIIPLGYMNCQHINQAVTLLTLSLGFLALTGSGFLVNWFDIAPQYSGFLSAVSNTFATFSGIIGPYLTGILTQDADNGWQSVFFIMAFLNIFSALFYALFAKADVQPWALQATKVHDF